MRTVVEAAVSRPPEQVFAFALDLDRWPGTISAIRRIEKLTSGPVGVGTRFRETRWMLGREASEEMTFAEIEPSRRIVLTAESHGTRYRTEEIFAPEGSGTRVRMVFEGRPVTLAAWLMMPLSLLMMGYVRRQLTQDLDDMKRALEA